MMERLPGKHRGALSEEDTWGLGQVQLHVGSQGGSCIPLHCQERPRVGRVGDGQPLCAFAVLCPQTVPLGVPGGSSVEACTASALTFFLGPPPGHPLGI